MQRNLTNYLVTRVGLGLRSSETRSISLRRDEVSAGPPQPNDRGVIAPDASVADRAGAALLAMAPASPSGRAAHRPCAPPRSRPPRPSPRSGRGWLRPG